MRSLRRILPEIDLSSQKISPEKLKEIKITKQDMNEAVREAHPSAMREILVQIPETKWDDVGGLDTLKKELLEAIEWPLKHAKEVQHFGVKTPVLLHGPPNRQFHFIAINVSICPKLFFCVITPRNFISF